MVGLVGLINKQLDDCCDHQLKMLLGKRLLAGWASFLPFFIQSKPIRRRTDT